MKKVLCSTLVTSCLVFGATNSSVQAATSADLTTILAEAQVPEHIRTSVVEYLESQNFSNTKIDAVTAKVKEIINIIGETSVQDLTKAQKEEIKQITQEAASLISLQVKFVAGTVEVIKADGTTLFTAVTHEIASVLTQVNENPKLIEEVNSIIKDVTPAGPFTDTEDHWSNDYVNSFYNKGFINGYADGTFRPDNSITRAEFVKLVNRAFGFTEKVEEIPFTDLDTAWKVEELKIAMAAGYITPAETFRHNDPINRQEAAKIIGSVLNLTGDAEKLQYSDADSISDWAKGFVQALVEEGVLTQKENFRPKDAIRRGEAVKMLEVASSK